MVAGLFCVLGLLIQPIHKAKPFTPARPDLYLPPAHGTVLCEVSVTTNLGEPLGSLTIPVPTNYAGQILTDFKVESDPPGAIKSWHWQSQPNGIDAWLDVDFNHIPGNHSFNHPALKWTGRFFAQVDEVFRTQNKEFAAWKGADKMVNSQDVSVILLAHSLKEGTKSQEEFVANVAHWVAFNQPGHLSGGWDSVSALKEGGISFSRACLCAALLRSSGVVARVDSYLPTDRIGSKEAQWLTEYFSDDGNWQMVEPTVGLGEVSRSSVVFLGAFPQTSLVWLMPNTTSPSEGTALSTAEVRRLKVFSVPNAPRVVTAAYGHTKTVLSLAKQGKDSWRDDKEFLPAMNAGITNFALYMEGKPMMKSSGH